MSLLIVLSPLQTPKKTPQKFAQRPLNSASKLPRRSPRILHKTPQRLEKTPGKSPAAKQTAAKCLGRYFSDPVQRVRSPAPADARRLHSLQVTFKDCSPAERLPPFCKEAGEQLPEQEGFAVPDASLSPQTASNAAAASPPARCFAEVQTPRCSLRSLSKSASPAGAWRPSQVPADLLPQATRSTPGKLEDPGSEFCASPLGAEVPQPAVGVEPPCSSPLGGRSAKAVAITSPSHAQAWESGWELGASNPSFQNAPDVTDTALRSRPHTPKQARCEPNSMRQNSTPACSTPENKDSGDDSGGNSLSLQLCQPQVTENPPVSGKDKQLPVAAQSSSSGENLEKLDAPVSGKPSAGGQVCAENAETEQGQLGKEETSWAKTYEAFLDGSQTVSDHLGAKPVLREDSVGLKALSLKRHSRFAQSTSPPVPKSPAYSLRCTADRRQREAAARMGEPQLPAKFSSPKGGCKPSASPPTYAVELEMQASGLPKLRIKKVGSCSLPEALREASGSRARGGESPCGEPAVTWCSRHPGKPAAACVSPSCFCSFHSTPGKGGGQTYICQSYTPTSCASTTTSPSPLEAGVPWTPSPKQKGKATPDAINDWPRRKRAAGSTANASCGQGERNADEQSRMAAGTGEVKISEHCSSKAANTFGEFELEGIYRLQDQASPSDSEARAEEDSATGSFGLRSRKRVFKDLSPEQLESQDAKRSCMDKHSLDLAAFSTEEGNRSKSRLESVLPEKLAAGLRITPERHSCARDDDVFLLTGNEVVLLALHGNSEVIKNVE